MRADGSLNLLLLGRWLPVARHGHEASRELRIARRLAERHSLTLAFTTDEPDPAGSVTALRDEFGDIEFAVVPRGWRCLSGAVRLAAGESCTLAYYRSAALSARLADLARVSRYDAAYVSSSSMIQYALELDPSIPIVMDFDRVDSEWWARRAATQSVLFARFYRTEAARLRRAEAQVARRARQCIAGSLHAARVVADLSPGARVAVIPSGALIPAWSREVDLLAKAIEMAAGVIPPPVELAAARVGS